MRDLLADARTALRVDVVRSLVPGGQKQVHVVVDASGEESILKLIDLGRASDPAALERARREVELLRGIDHPNVVKVRSELLELGTPPDAAFWLDEFVILQPVSQTTSLDMRVGAM
jgi:hypothetical protein